MTEIRQIVADIVPGMYDSIAADFHYPPGTNLAGSNQCHVLSKGLWIALKNRGIETRRERHEAENGDWHYLIAHAPVDAEPSDEDVITDLNPWQFMDRPPLNLGYLHGTRDKVTDIMESHGASQHARSLRLLSTLSIAHVVTMQSDRDISR
ncbi:hypothetical protein H7142_01055 [Candidatus Saccharibacteria bacterium]|nr:hypothetical protein [Candidatus Saccharibacteria bacterium]